jgi:hypothetical protein
MTTFRQHETFAKVGWARAFNVLAPAFEDTTLQVDLDTLVSVLEALPGYAEITLTLIDGEDRREFDLMARDMTGPGRRFTNLTTGSEWFNVGEIITLQAPQFITATRRGEESPTLLVSL